MSNLHHHPSIFIGIGGSGIKSLARLKFKMYEKYKLEGKLKDPSQGFNQHKFIFIDTSIVDKQKINDAFRSQMDDNTELIGREGSEFFVLGNTVPKDVVAEKYEDVKKWLPENGLPTVSNRNEKYIFKPSGGSLTDGAKANRLEGRLSFVKNFSEIRLAIINAIGDTRVFWTNQSQTQQKKIKVPIWLISGSNGGTGSSFALDILYTLHVEFQSIYQDQIGEPAMRWVVLAPHPYVELPSNRENWQYKPNSLAFFREYEFFKTTSRHTNEDNSYNFLFPLSVYENHTYAPKMWNPSIYTMVFDTTFKEASLAKLDISQTFENVANTLFSLTCSKAGTEIEDTICNIDPNQRNQFEYSGNEYSILKDSKWTRDIVATGVKSLKKPISIAQTYLQSKITIELLRKGLIGNSFVEVHKTKEEQENELNNFIQRTFGSLLDLKSGDFLFKNNEFTKSFIDLNDNIDLITEPKKEGLIRKSYTDKALTGIWTTFKKDEIDVKINKLRDNFKSNKGFGFEDQIKNIEQKLIAEFNTLILAHGVRYVKDLIHEVDAFLSYPPEDLPKNSVIKKIKEDYLRFEDKKLFDQDTAISNSANENLDFEDLKDQLKVYTEWLKNKYIAEFSFTLVSAFYKNINSDNKNEGILDKYYGRDGSSSYCLMLESFEKEDRELNEQFKEWTSKQIKLKEERPFEYFLPSIDDQIENNKWKEKSRFNDFFIDIISSSNNLNDQKSIVSHIGKFTTEYKVDFFEIAIKSDTLTLISLMKNLNEFSEKIIQKNSKFMNWKTESLEKEWDDFKANNPSAASTYSENFARPMVTYPTRKSGLGYGKDALFVTSLYYAGTNKLAKELGFKGGDEKFEQNQDVTELLKVTFEYGHSLGEYINIDDYANAYINNFELLQKNPISYTNKHFVLSDFKSVLKSANINTAKGKNNFLEMFYYSAVFNYLKNKNTDIYSRIFKEDNTSGDSFLGQDLVVKVGDKSDNLIWFDKEKENFKNINYVKINNSEEQINLGEFESHKEEYEGTSWTQFIDDCNNEVLWGEQLSNLENQLKKQPEVLKVLAEMIGRDTDASEIEKILGQSLNLSAWTIDSIERKKMNKHSETIKSFRKSNIFNKK